MRFLKFLAGALVAVAAGTAVAFVVAGRQAGPAIAIEGPPAIGQSGTLDVIVETPGAALDALSIVVEQQDRVFPVFTFGVDRYAADADSPDRITISRPIGKTVMADLQAGRATVVVTAERPVFGGLRRVASRETRDFEVRLDPPRVAVVSTLHYVNLGGSEMVVYRVSPPDVESGVQVGDYTYPGFPLSSSAPADGSSVRAAFFALLHDQPLDAPIHVYAIDPAGNETRTTFDVRTFPKTFRRSRITIGDDFLAKVVPAISGRSSEAEPLDAFLAVNGALRRQNAETIAGFAGRTTPEMLWTGAFQRLRGSQTESGFADYRTYFYQGKEIDQQVHLGFDLASTAASPVEAANHGMVVHAGDLGIYGNTVVIDHGFGVQSLYAHLSSFEVDEGQSVALGEVIGRTGQTGLAAGDHLHFSMLVNGRFVNAVEWWDAHWIEDRIQRKLRDAGLTTPPAASDVATPSR